MTNIKAVIKLPEVPADSDEEEEELGIEWIVVPYTGIQISKYLQNYASDCNTVFTRKLVRVSRVRKPIESVYNRYPNPLPTARTRFWGKGTALETPGLH